MSNNVECAVFVDGSGSVHGPNCDPYHDVVAHVAEQNPDATFIVWGDGYEVADQRSVLRNAKGPKLACASCQCGTSLMKGVWAAIKARGLSCERLVIITDGDVGAGDIDAVRFEIQKLGGKVPWATCHVYVIHPTRPSANVVPTVPASMEATYRGVLGEILAAIEVRRNLHKLPCDPADIARVLKLGINRQKRAELEV
jgi:hypothetical protein